MANDANSDNSFEIFWEVYPRKVAKGAARKAWRKASPPLEIVLDTLDWQIVSDGWTKDGGKFIPHPATWINQERWLDEPDIATPARPKPCPQCGNLDGVCRSNADCIGRVLAANRQERAS
jgi:hypothetical protein